MLLTRKTRFQESLATKTRQEEGCTVSEEEGAAPKCGKPIQNLGVVAPWTKSRPIY
jgi:hypothetical protein